MSFTRNIWTAAGNEILAAVLDVPNCNGEL